MGTIRWFIKTVFYLLRAIPDSRRIIRLQKNGDPLTARLFTQARVRHWAIAMLRYAGVSADVYGLENIPKGPVLFAPNHQSDWDIMLAETYLDQCGILAKQELSHLPLARTWMELLGIIYIDRSNARQSVKALKLCEQQLTEGRNFIIFPEGTRSKSEEIGEFKAGTLRIAAKHGIPIIPVSIDGSYKIMEANQGKWIRPGHVIMTIHTPVDTAAMDKAEQKNIGTIIRQAVLEARETGRTLYAGQTGQKGETA